LPMALDQLVARMLAKDRADRPRDASAVAAALETIGDIGESERLPVSARAPALTASEQRPASVGLVARGPAEVRATTDEAAIPTRAMSVRHGPDDAANAADDSTGATMSVEQADETLPALWAAVANHGGRAELLADGSVVATVLGQGTATDR